MERKNKQKIVLVILFLMIFVLVIPFVSAEIIFSDNFESGNISSWTGTSVSNVPIINSEVVYSGVYSINVSAVDYSYLYYTVSPTSSIFLRQYVYFDGYVGDGFYSVINGIGQDADTLTGNPFLRVGVYGSSGNMTLMCRFRNNAANSNNVTSVILEPLTWYAIETKLVVGSGSGEVRVFVDEVESLTMTNLDNDDLGVNINTVGVGVVSIPSSGAVLTYHDSIVISDVYVGLEELEPTPTPSPTPSPSPVPTEGVTPAPVVDLNTDMIVGLCVMAFLLVLNILSMMKFNGIYGSILGFFIGLFTFVVGLSVVVVGSFTAYVSLFVLFVVVVSGFEMFFMALGLRVARGRR